MKKIAIVLHEISPHLGSECRSGFQFVINIVSEIQISNYSSNIDIYIPRENIFLTVNYYNDLIIYLSKVNLKCNIVPVCFPAYFSKLRLWLGRMQKSRGGVGNVFVYNILYYIWLKRVKGRVLKIGNYDVLHFINHINLFNIISFSSCANKIVLGPLTGISFVPFSYLNGLYPIVKESCRLLIQTFFAFRAFFVFSCASVLYVVSKDDLIYYSKLQNIKVRRIPEQCLEENELPPLNKFNGELKIVWIGELTYRKQLNILLKSISQIDNPEFKYSLDIIGSGPLLDTYKKYVDEHSLNNVSFHGKISRSEVMKILSSTNVLVHTSYREGTATTILEALATGNYVLAHDIGGHDLVVGSRGKMIQLESLGNSISQFSIALSSLFVNFSTDSMEICRTSSVSYNSIVKKIIKDYEV